MTLLFSVLMPAYQAVATIDAAVESVVAQRLESWELVIADDGSTDGTYEKALAWRAREERVRLVHHVGRTNLGRPATRNLTVREARGSLVAFLDADDLWLPEALTVFRQGFERFPTAAVVYAEAETFGEAPIPPPRARGIPNVEAHMLRQLARFNTLVTSATAVRRSAFPDPPFPETLPLAQDWACWLSLARSYPFVFLPQTVARYRLNSAGGQAVVALRDYRPQYFGWQVGHLRSLAREATTAEEARAFREGLEFRATEAFQMAASALRRGRLARSLNWLRRGFVAAGSLRGLALAAMEVFPRQRLVWRRGELPLTITSAPDPAERRTAGRPGAE